MAEIQRIQVTQSVTKTHIDLGPAAPGTSPEKIRVIRRSDSVPMFCNARDFGAKGEKNAAGQPFEFTSDHYVHDENYDPDEGKLAEDQAPTNRESLYTAEQMADLTVAELRALPEYSRVPADIRRSARSKDALIEALIAARRPQARAQLDD